MKSNVKQAVILIFAVALSSVSAQSLDFTKCTSTTDCINNCECVPDVSICVNKEIATTQLSKCLPCGSDDDCPNDVCETLTGMCAQCVITGMNTATKTCIPDTLPVTQNDENTVASTTEPKIELTPAPVEITNQQPVQPPTTDESIENETESIDSVSFSAETDDVEIAESPEPKKCVSTAFLRQNNLLHMALNHGEHANVLCIPGLPCATSGHLVRSCTTDHSCRLVTYREICDNRVDCIESRMPVSQLSHKYDWSQFRSISDSVVLSLTSLSVNPDSASAFYYSSWTIAAVADMLIKNGLGIVCDMASVTPSTIHKVVMIARNAAHGSSL